MSFFTRWSKVIKRDGLTFEEDRSQVLDMLCLCGECDGIGDDESYSSYLRRLLDRLIVLEKAAHKRDKGNAN